LFFSSKCNYLPFCYSCCRNTEDPMEEVVVVHHSALRKVNFLLKYDELARCESPGIPACVSAVKQRKLHKNILGGQDFDLEENSFSGMSRIHGLTRLSGVHSPKSDDFEESTCSEDGNTPTAKPLGLSQAIDHIVQERKRLQNFLQRMAVDGLGCKTLEKTANHTRKQKTENAGSDADEDRFSRRIRGIIRNCNIRIVEERDELHLVLDLERMAPRVVPFPSISFIIFGSPEDSIEGEDPKLCLFLVQRTPRAPNESADCEIFHYVTFFNTTDRDFFKQGVRRLRSHNHLMRMELSTEQSTEMAARSLEESMDEMARGIARSH